MNHRSTRLCGPDDFARSHNWFTVTSGTAEYNAIIEFGIYRTTKQTLNENVNANWTDSLHKKRFGSINLEPRKCRMFSIEISIRMRARVWISKPLDAFMIYARSCSRISTEKKHYWKCGCCSHFRRCWIQIIVDPFSFLSYVYSSDYISSQWIFTWRLVGARKFPICLHSLSFFWANFYDRHLLMMFLLGRYVILK